MNRFLIGSLTFVLGAAVLYAQTPDPAPTPAPAPAPTPAPTGETGGDAGRVARRAQEMRDQLGQPKQVKSHVRVQVRLKNGNRLRGVVKDGRLVERVNGLRFVDANAAEKGAGIRLWYSGGTRNYVFVPFEELQTYSVLQRLTTQQLSEIEAEMQMHEAEREEQMRKEQLARAAKKDATPAGTGTESPGDKSDPQADPKADPKADAKDGKSEPAPESAHEKNRRYYELLQDYPPAGGWNESKRDEIKRRFAVIGARPSDFEQKFVDQFDVWKLACASFGVDVKKDETKEKESDGRRNRRSDRKK